MSTIIDLFMGRGPKELDEKQIVYRICQHLESSIVQLKYNMVFDAFNNVVLSEDIYEKVKANFDVIFVDVFNIFLQCLRKKAKRYSYYRPHCENFILQFSSFKDGDDLSDVIKDNEPFDAMYIVSRRQEKNLFSVSQEARITKISKMSKVVDAYSIKMAHDFGFEIKSDHRFSAPLSGLKSLEIAIQKDVKIQKEPCWGKLNAMGMARFEGGERSVGLYYNTIRVGGDDTPLEKNGVIGIRLQDAGNIPYAVISKEGTSFFISGTGLLNGAIHLSTDSRKPLPNGSKILLGDVEIMFTSILV